MIRYVLAIALAAGTSLPAMAQETLEGRVGLGAGFAPEYDGADEYKPIPIVPLSIRWHGIGVQTAGQGLQFDVVPLQLLNAGPIVEFRGGRDDVDDPVIARLPDIDPSVEVGGFVEVNLPFFAPGHDAITVFARVSADVTGSHNGWQATPGMRYSVPIGDDWRIDLIGSTTFASDDYNDAFFSVTPAGSAASGLPVFVADGGLHDVAGTVSATYLFTDHWGVQGIARYSRLLNDAAESPIVDQRGSKHQFLGGLAFVYKF